MKTTVAALRELQDYWDSLDPRPNIREIAAMAGMSYSTAARYLNGTTKQGLPDSVRALARALDREDIMSEVTDNAMSSVSQMIMLEIQRQAEENLRDGLNSERAFRKESEARFSKMIADNDLHISQLTNRLQILEEEKGAALALLKENRAQKRKYEKVALALLLVLGIYFIIFDLPHPDYGITEVLLGFLNTP